MAEVTISNIKKYDLVVEDNEISIDELHPMVAGWYREKGYEDAPKTEDEAKARGVKNFNAVQNYFKVVEEKDTRGGKAITLNVRPGRYLISRATDEAIKAEEDNTGKIYTMAALKDICDYALLGVSGVIITKVEDKHVKRFLGSEYCIVAQVKGKAIGSGQIHAGAFAGGVRPKNLKAEDPLMDALYMQSAEELGLDLRKSQERGDISIAVSHLVDERETGQGNIAFALGGVNFDKLMDEYERNAIAKINETLNGKSPKDREYLEKAIKNLEVKGLSILPIPDLKKEAGYPETLVLFPVDNKRLYGVKKIVCCYPNFTQGRLDYVQEPEREIRPYTKATLDFLLKQKNIETIHKRLVG